MGSILFGIIAGACTTIGIMQMRKWLKAIYHCRLLQDSGVRVMGRLTRKWTFTRKRGKTRVTAYAISVLFKTRDAQQSINRAMEVGCDEYRAYRCPSNIEMIYLPTSPTLCDRYPVPRHTWCAHLTVIVVSPSLTLFGPYFTYWTGAHGSVLVVYLVWVACFLGMWATGRCDKLGHGTVIATEPPVAQPTNGTVAVGEVVDLDASPEDGIPVVEGHRVVPRPLGAPLLPRSLTAGRGFRSRLENSNRV